MAGKEEEAFFQWTVGCIQNYSNTVEIAGKKAGSKTNDRKQRREIEIRAKSNLCQGHSLYLFSPFSTYKPPLLPPHQYILLSLAFLFFKLPISHFWRI